MKVGDTDDSSQVPTPVGSFRQLAEAHALSWKAHSSSLPEAARQPGQYAGQPRSQPTAICLPADYAAWNLLPDIRDAALSLFSGEQIVWHGSVDGGPSNHLLDSQVQCVNALGPGLGDPGFVWDLFHHLLPIAEVLEIEDGRYLTFEYIGAVDHLGETGPGQPRTRGSMSTSADAAIRYRTPQGAVEVALIEWKYTEDYRGSELAASKRPNVREDRYRSLWESTRCPVRRDLIPYEDLFVEPLYQLLRQQLLAQAMEETHELGAEVVRVLHLCPSANEGVHQAANRPSQRAVAEDPLAIWTKLCVRPDRFITKDPGFVLPLRGSEYASRYPATGPTTSP